MISQHGIVASPRSHLKLTPFRINQTPQFQMQRGVSRPHSTLAFGLALGGVTLVALGTTIATRSMKTFTPTVISQPTRLNQALLALCPALTNPYKLPAFLNNGHVETIFAALFRKKPHICYRRELIHMPDGGTVALDTEDQVTTASLPSDAPVLILLPGLTGGSEDSYVQHAVVHAREAGIRAVVFNGRGTSDTPVTSAQFYSASYTGDMRAVVSHVASQFPFSTLYAAGWSLGANILTCYLGEEGEEVPLTAAVAMCNPFNLPLARRNFRKGINKIYDWNLASNLNKIYTQHKDLFERAAAEGTKPYNIELAKNAKTIREFDEAITIVSFGWPSVDAYYEGSSSSKSIPKITIPLLVIQSEDDPIAPPEGIPFDELKANPLCVLVTTPTGGHLGWCSGGNGVLGAPWSDAGVSQYFQAIGKLVEQPDMKEELGVRPRAEREPAGVTTEGFTTHQAP